MRVDFQQGEHLRVGPVLITWHPDIAHHRPGLHEVQMGEVRADTRKVERVAHLAEQVVADAEPLNLVAYDIYSDERVDRRLINKLEEALTDWHLSVEHERFGGVAVPVRGRLLCVGWLGASPPRVDRLRWSEVRRRRAMRLRRLLGDGPMGIACMDAEPVEA